MQPSLGTFTSEAIIWRRLAHTAFGRKSEAWTQGWGGTVRRKEEISEKGGREPPNLAFLPI